MTVHLYLLHGIPKLVAPDGQRDKAAITGSALHTLVHFLYTGLYQCPKPEAAPSAEEQPATSELETAIMVYAAAQTYELPILEKLARHEIKILGKGLPEVSILEAAKKGWQNQADDPWLAEYLSARLETLLEDPSALLSSNVLGGFADSAPISRILLGGMLKALCKKAEPNPDAPAPEPAPAEEFVFPKIIARQARVLGILAEDQPEHYPETELAPEPEPGSKLEEPPAIAYDVPEPAVGDWDWDLLSKSKKKKKKKAKTPLWSAGCEVWLDHVTRGDEWKSCPDCREFVKGLAGGLEDKDDFTTDPARPV